MNGDAFFYSNLTARQLSDYVYDLHLADGALVSEAWHAAEEVERKGRAACVFEIERLATKLKLTNYSPVIECLAA